MTNRILLLTARVFPKKLRNKVDDLITYGGLKANVNAYLGAGLITGIIISITIILISYFLNLLNLTSILIAIGIPIGVLGLLILYPYFKAEQRAKKVESFLPDFLNLTSANLRSGSTPLASMMGAAKEEFGILSEEVSDAIALSMGSESYEKILGILVKRIKSVILDRIVKLLITGIKTGGNLASLLEGAAEEVTQIKNLKNELVTSVKSYMIFIIIVIAVGLPFLLNVSTYFVQTVKGLQSKITPSQVTPELSSSTITVEFLNMVSYIVIIVTSLFASLLTGSVVDESFVQGLKYFLPLVAISILIFIISGNLIPQLLGNLNLF